MSLAPAADQIAMDPAELEHLLRRTEYVARPERVAALVGLTRAQAVADVLAIPATPVAIPTYIDHDIAGEGYQQLVYATQWWIDRMVDAPRPMLERMTWFWHGHFCSSWWKVNGAKAMMEQNKLFRDSALGNFRTLTQAMSVQTAMLIYLDNIYNYASSPNQNFARELMELFTIGVGNYTESDVTAAARAWTGHGIDWTTRAYVFRAGDHDTGQKTFMGVTRNWDGPDIVNFLLSENATTKLLACKFLTRKWWEHFAYENPPQALVDQLAQVLFDNNLEIKPWVQAMLVHDEFYSVTARQGLVRSPVEFVAAVEYHSGMRGAQLHPEWYLEGMGQMPFLPPNVAGWDTNAYWLTTSGFGSRADFARYATWQLRAGGANDIGKGRTPDQTVDYLAAMFDLDLSSVTRQALLGYIAVQRTNEPWIGWWEATNLLTMAMLTPEMHLA